MNIKKIISVLLIFALLALTMVFSLTACNKDDAGDDTKKDDANSDAGGETAEDAGPQAQSFITEAATGERNDYDGSVGYEFECLADMTVSAVGRPENGAMNDSHTIRIWDVETETLLAQATVTPESPVDALGFKTAQLGNSLSLKAGVSYRIVSEERKDGDQWYDIGTTADMHPDLKPSADCRIVIPSFTPGEAWDQYPSATYNPEGAVNKGYTGVTFYYILD
jgi:hypothetical protein